MENMEQIIQIIYSISLSRVRSASSNLLAVGETTFFQIMAPKQQYHQRAAKRLSSLLEPGKLEECCFAAPCRPNEFKQNTAWWLTTIGWRRWSERRRLRCRAIAQNVPPKWNWGAQIESKKEGKEAKEVLLPWLVTCLYPCSPLLAINLV